MPLPGQHNRLYATPAPGTTLDDGGTVHMWTLGLGNVAAGNHDWTTPANFDVEVVAVELKKGVAGGAGDTHTVQNGANVITNAMDTNVAADVIVRPTLINRANSELAGGSTLRVVVADGGAGNTGCEIDIYWRRT